MVARKLQTAFAHRLTPILCIGDTLEQHQAGQSEEAVRTQLEVLLRVYHLTGGPFVVAYEPAWSISSGEHARECTAAEAADRHGFTRSSIADELGAQTAAGTTLFYGGSVTAADADAYFTQPDIDGGLVGAASQDLSLFHALINATITTYEHPQPDAGHQRAADSRSPHATGAATPRRAPTMAKDSPAFRIKPGKQLDLNDLPTTAEPLYTSQKDYKKQLKKLTKRLSSLQRLHYASDHWSLLLIFQGMDAAGKDGAIRHVMSGVNPQGCQVFSFKQPTDQELDHDFLWRTTRCLPERGRIGIFNRSYYEDVLVTRVHPDMLHRHGLPDELIDEKVIWKQRYRSIGDLEAHLHRNGTQIGKIFLHLSKDEQAKRFRARIDAPDKNWKFSLADIHERSYWDTYMKVYGDCISATSAEHAPWYVVPADDKPNARLIISHIVLDTLGSLKMAYRKRPPNGTKS